jgi:hypothetical protein
MNMNLIGNRRAFCTITFGLALGLAAPNVRAQTIGGVSGTLSHGNSVALTGSAFGAKAQAAPVKWDDFEGHTDGSVLNTADGWDAVSGWSYSRNQDDRVPVYSSTAAHSGSLGMMTRNIDGVSNSSVRMDANYSTGFYLDAWYEYVPDPAQPSNNNKVFMLYGSGAAEYPQTAMTGFCRLTSGFTFPTYAASSGGFNDNWYSPVRQNMLMSGMHHLQVWLKPSSDGVENGVVWVSVDGVTSTDTAWRTVANASGYWRQARLGFWQGHNDDGVCPVSGGHYTYWDNVYIDNTQSRVELGNASTYGACTHREIQVPTSWSDSQVSVAFNQGTFGGGETAYLYVVTANGAVSPGYRVTLGETPISGPGKPGTPVF